MSTVRCSWNSSKNLRISSPDVVEGLLQQYGKLEWFKPQVGNNNSTAYARFTNAESADKSMHALHNTRPDRLGRKTKLYVNKIISVRYNLPIKIVDALTPFPPEISQDLQQKPYVQINFLDGPSKYFATIILTAQTLDAVVYGKSVIEKLLEGSVVKDGEAALWHHYFSSVDALHDLCKLHSVHKVYIHRDNPKQQLLLYGGSTAQQAAVTEALVATIRSLRPSIYRLVLTPKLVQIALNGGIRRVSERLGSAVYLETTQNPMTMTLAGGTEEEFQNAVELLMKGTGKTVALAAALCPICDDRPREPLRSSCGHSYCKECFEQWTNSALSNPGNWARITCCGRYRNGEACEYTFTLDELRSMIPSTTFERMLRSAFDAYIGANPKALHFCPTPDCTQVYQPTGKGDSIGAHGDEVTTRGDGVTTFDEESTNGAVITCSSCLNSICTKCHASRHAGFTCKESKGHGEEARADLERAKASMGARDCPVCTTTIVKSGGCNHVQCLACHVHICWKCMRAFEDAQIPGLDEEGDGAAACYEHMVVVHGTDFDDLDDFDDEDEDEDEDGGGTEDGVEDGVAAEDGI